MAASEFGDFHNRMTHTLKVAQLGRRLAQYLGHQAAGGKKARPRAAPRPPDPELFEATCLAHDLGHPPFGHAGEEALKDAVDELVVEDEAKKLGRAPTETEALAAKTAYGGFEGNAQTLRILTRLCARQPAASRGLDLTRATLDATIKYPWLRQEHGKGARKWNVYPGDLTHAEWIRKDHPLGFGADKSFEADAMDWCDDVTYACHDVEDFYRAGIIPLHELFNFPPRKNPAAVGSNDEPRVLGKFLDFVGAKWTKADIPWDRDEAIFEWRGIGRLLKLPTAYNGDRRSKVAIHRGSSALMTYFVNGVTWEGAAPLRYEGSLEIDRAARLRCNLLQELIWYFVIRRQALASQQIGQQKIVRDLLRIYYTSDGDHRLMPDDRMEEIEEHGDYLRGCIDHIASMTEAGALAMHHRLTGVRVGLHSDPIWRT